ncbi:MAG: hypothetical protein UDG86_13965 [Lachnospiraceae bacterium]|jgi:hypothetical protein|nr:hypothetical protein [Lachnospiraceae bacterium]
MRCKKVKLSDILIVLLSLSLLLFLFSGIHSLMDEFRDVISYDEQSFAWDLQDQNYSEMLRKTVSNEVSGAEASDTLKEYYALSRYYEAAMYYKMYSDNGQQGKADSYAETMTREKEKTGYLKSEISEINNLLSIKE